MKFEYYLKYKEYLGTYLAFFLIISLVSCRKDEIIMGNTIPFLIVGAETPEVSIMSFPSPIPISVVYDTLNLYGNGSYDFDFDLDGESEMTLDLNLINNDSIHLLNGGTPNYYPSLSLKSNNKVSIITEQEIVYVGQGGTTTLVWLKALNEGVEINNSSEWKILNEEGVKMWYEMPMPLSHKGTWHDLTENKFIGFRYEDKLGWIEINATDLNNPLIVSYAIQR